jgi:hypothetical protein
VLLIASCVAAVTVALSGAATPVRGIEFGQAGHWIANPALGLLFHINGASKDVDVQATVPGLEPGSQVVQGDTNGYVVGGAKVLEFGKSSLAVEKSTELPTGELPVAIEVAGGPYLVYRQAGRVVRLGERGATISASGSLGEPVASRDGTLWVNRLDTGSLCQLPKDAEAFSCPAVAPQGHTGGLTIVGDKPVFVDTAADKLISVGATGLGDSVDIGLDVPPTAKLASSDAGGRVAILDPVAHRMHLIDTAGLSKDRPRVAPVTVDLPAGEYSGPAAAGSSVVLLDRGKNSLLTYSSDGKDRKETAIPAETGEPRLTRGEDERVYVDGAEGKHVVVVDPDGAVSQVPVVGPEKPVETRSPAAPPVEKPDAPTGQPVNQPGQPQGNQGPKPPVQPKPPVKPKPTPTSTPKPPPAPPAPPVEQPASVPGAPANVTAKAGPGTATINWGAAPANGAAVTAYLVTWKPASGAGGSATVDGGTRSRVLSGLTGGVAYQVTVVAENSAGRGSAGSVRITPTSTKTVSIARGRAETYPAEGCTAENCALIAVTMKGFRPNTSYHVDPRSTNTDYSNEGKTMETDEKGDLFFEAFHYGIVGSQVWVVVDGMTSNRITWTRGS